MTGGMAYTHDELLDICRAIAAYEPVICMLKDHAPHILERYAHIAATIITNTTRLQIDYWALKQAKRLRKRRICLEDVDTQEACWTPSH